MAEKKVYVSLENAIAGVLGWELRNSTSLEVQLKAEIETASVLYDLLTEDIDQQLVSISKNDLAKLEDMLSCDDGLLEYLDNAAEDQIYRCWNLQVLAKNDIKTSSFKMLRKACEQRVNIADEKFTEQIAMYCNVCEARLNLLYSLESDAYAEIEKGKGKSEFHFEQKSSSIKVKEESFLRWVKRKHKITYTLPVLTALKDTEGIKWKDIELRLYRDFTLSVKILNNSYVSFLPRIHFQNLKLWNRRLNKPKIEGKLLVDLFDNNIIKATQRKNMVGVSKALYELTGMLKDEKGLPFEAKNDFYMPKFKVKDQRSINEERIEKSRIRPSIKKSKQDDFGYDEGWEDDGIETLSGQHIDGFSLECRSYGIEDMLIAEDDQKSEDYHE
ncbi:MAG: hypothetical protein HOE61_13600 [Candidatus Marinimicrobia bacterium]|nr:hypothetical protein [Candidatus Neomarinimicrobiota bacterium]MBT5271246.1 hypothetical protein [Candidatus Neomarinimicrobiota bacterium]